MKRYLALIVAILFVFAVSSVAIATEKPAAPVEKKDAAKPAVPAEKPKTDAKSGSMVDEKKAVKAKQVTGEVAAVDAAAKSITVKGKKADVTMTADPKLLADVKVGDKVTAKYTVQDGKNVAKSIKKAAAKTDAKKAEPAKAEKPKADAKPVEPAKPAEPVKKQ